jgi:hypothetical protein
MAPLPLPIRDSELKAVSVEFTNIKFQNFTELKFFVKTLISLFNKRSKLVILSPVNFPEFTAFIAKKPNFKRCDL